MRADCGSLTRMNPAARCHPALARSLAFLEANWRRPIKTADLVAAALFAAFRLGFIRSPVRTDDGFCFE